MSNEIMFRHVNKKFRDQFKYVDHYISHTEDVKEIMNSRIYGEIVESAIVKRP